MRQEHLELPPDVSNGLPPNLLLNILPSTSPKPSCRSWWQGRSRDLSRSRSSLRASYLSELATAPGKLLISFCTLRLAAWLG